MIERALDPSGKHFGSITVEGAKDGAAIYVDDQIRGTVPAGQMGNVQSGARRIRVLAEGYEPFERWVVVKSGETTSVPVTLKEVESPPVYATWWFWTITGVVVAGAAVGTVYLVSQDDAGPGTGTTGVSVMVNSDAAFTGGR
jgi:hypothetical protein